MAFFETDLHREPAVYMSLWGSPRGKVPPRHLSGCDKKGFALSFTNFSPWGGGNVPDGEGGMFQAFVFSSPRSRRPLAWRRASGSYVMGGQAEDQRPTLFTGRTHVTPDRAYLVEKPRHSARWGPRCRLPLHVMLTLYAPNRPPPR